MLEDFFTKSIQFIKLNNLKYKRYFVKQCPNSPACTSFSGILIEIAFFF